MKEWLNKREIAGREPLRRSFGRSVILLLLLLVVLPGGALFAQDGWRDDGYYWVAGVGYELNQGRAEATVKASSVDLSGVVVLPDALTVVRNEKGSLQAVKRYKVTEVGEGAFKGCLKITSVVLGSDVRSVGLKAFEGCMALAGVEYLGNDAPAGVSEAYGGAVTKVPSTALLFTTPTGHGSLQAMLNGQIIGSGVLAAKGELVVTAVAAENYRVARAGEGEYTASEVGVTIDGRPAKKAEANLASDGTTVTVRITLDGQEGKRIGVAFMPQKVSLHFGVLQSRARTFKKAGTPGSSWDNRDGALEYVLGGSLRAKCDGVVVEKDGLVEWGANVEYEANPGEGVEANSKDFHGKSVWAVEGWYVRGVKDQKNSSTKFSHAYKGDPVHVRFKRTKFLMRFECGAKTVTGSEAKFQNTVQLREGFQVWVDSGATGVIEATPSNPRDYKEVAVTANGIWVRGKQYAVREDVLVNVYYSQMFHGTQKIALVVTTFGPGQVRVEDPKGAVVEDRVQMPENQKLIVKATPNPGAEIRNLTIAGVPVYIKDPTRAVQQSQLAPKGNLAYRVFATFAAEGRQIVTVVEEGECAVTVTREGRELRNGDQVLPGDKLKIVSQTLQHTGMAGYTPVMISLTVNGERFNSGDTFVVGQEDVNITAYAVSYYNSQRRFVLSYEVRGPGHLEFSNDNGRQSYGQGSQFFHNQRIKITAVGERNARLVSLTANGINWKSGEVRPFPNEDLHVKAIFAEKGEYVLLQEVNGDGYIEVLRGNQRLKSGDAVRAGDLLEIRALPSANAESELQLLEVNDVPWESGRVYFVKKNEDVKVSATFAKKHGGAHFIHLVQKGKGFVRIRKTFPRREDLKPPYVIGRGEMFQVTAQVAPGGGPLQRLEWNGEAIENGTGGLVAGNGDVVLFAHFGDAQYLYLPALTGGIVEVTRNGEPLGTASEIAVGDLLKIVAKPRPGYTAGNIYANGELVLGGQYQVPNNRNVEIIASFYRSDELTITLLSTRGGSLSAKQGDRFLTNKDNVIARKTANGQWKVDGGIELFARLGSGQLLVSLSVNGITVPYIGSAVSSGYIIPVDSINKNQIVRAVFGPIGKSVLSINIVGDKGGMLEVWESENGHPKQRLSNGSDVTGKILAFVPKPAKGWKLKQLKVNGKVLSVGQTFTVGSGNVGVSAEFEQIDYKLSIAALPSASGTVTVKRKGSMLQDGATVHYGDLLEVEALPASGNEVKGISVSNAQKVGATTWEVQGDARVEVTFGSVGKSVLVVDVQPNAAAGTVVVTDAAGAPVAKGTELVSGKQLTVAAQPSQGYRLLALKINGAEVHSPYTFTVEGEVYVVAYFEEEPLAPGAQLSLVLSKEGGGQGSIKVMRDGVGVHEGSGVLAEGDVLYIEAKADKGSRCAALLVDGMEVSNPLRGYEVKRSVIVKAVFAKEGQYAVVVNTTGPGCVRVKRNGGELKFTDLVSAGDELTIEAEPDADAYTSSLIVDGGPFVSGESVVVRDRDVRVNATFAANSQRMVLTMLSTPGGTLRVLRSGDALLNGAALREGDALTVMAVPDDGYRLDLLLLNGKKFANGSIREVKANESITVDARFAPKGKQTLQLVQGRGGRLTVVDVNSKKSLFSGDALYEGQSIKAVAAANPGAEVKELRINDVKSTVTGGLTAEQSYVVKASDETVVVESSFEVKEYDLVVEPKKGDGDCSIIVSRGGVVLTPGKDKVSYGDDLKIEVRSQPGSQCKGVWVNKERLSGVSPYHYRVGVGNVTISYICVADGSTNVFYVHPEVRLLNGAQGTLVVKRGAQELQFGEQLHSNEELQIVTKPGPNSYLSVLKVNHEELQRESPVIWKVPSEVENSIVTVLAEFLPNDRYRLKTFIDGSGELKVTSLDGKQLYKDGSVLLEGSTLLITAKPRVGTVCKMLQVNGEDRAIDPTTPEQQITHKVEKGDVTVWAAFGSADEYKLLYRSPIEGRIVVTDIATGQELKNGSTLTQGQKIRVEAMPKEDMKYALKELKVNGKATASGAEVEVRGDIKVQASFATAHALRVTVSPNNLADNVQVVDATTKQAFNEWVADGLNLEVVAATPIGYNDALVQINGEETTTHTVCGDVNVSVEYTRKSCKLTVETSGLLAGETGGAIVSKGGQTLPLSNGSTGDAEVLYGEELMIVPMEVAGYGATLSSGTNRLTMEGDVTVTVVYTRNVQTWLSPLVEPASLANEGGVEVTDRNGGGVDKSALKTGDVLKIKAKRVAGYDVTKAPEVTVLSGLTFSSGEYTVSGGTAIQLKVVYTPNIYTLSKAFIPSTLPGAGCKVVEQGKTDELSAVHHDQKIEVTADDVAGYDAGVKVEGVDENPDGSYTVKGNVTVTVTYTPKSFKLTKNPVENAPAEAVYKVVEKGQDIDLSDVHFGQVIEVKPAEVEGFHTRVVVKGGVKDNNDGSYTVTGDVMVMVYYMLNKYDLSVESLLDGEHFAAGGATVKRVGSSQYGAQANGEVTPGSGAIQHFNRLEIEAKPVVGYDARVEINGEQTTACIVKGNVAVTVTYTLKSYTISKIFKPFGLSGVGCKVVEKGKTDALSTVHHGQKIEVTADDVAGYDAKVEVEGADDNQDGSYTVTGDVIVTVTYTPKSYKLNKTFIPTTLSGAGCKVVEQGMTDALSTVYYGQKIEVTANSVLGYYAEVKVEGADENQDGSFTVTGDVTVTVTYTPKKCTLTVVKTGLRSADGEVKVNDEAVETSKEVRYGDRIKIQAAVKPGAERVRIEKLEIESEVYFDDTQHEVIVTGDLTVQAHFGDVDALGLVVSALPQGCGRVIVKGERSGALENLTENDELILGEELTITAEGKEVQDSQGQKVKYVLQSLKVGSVLYGPSELPVRMRVRETVRIVARFVPESSGAPVLPEAVHLVTSIKGNGNGTLSVMRDGVELTDGAELQPGDELTVTASAANGSELLTLYVAHDKKLNPAHYVVTGHEANGIVKVEATFKKAGGLGFSVTTRGQGRIEVRRGGRALPHDAELVEGEKLTIVAVPAAGYEVTRLAVEGLPFVSGDEYTVERSFSVYGEFGLAGQQLLVVDCGQHGAVTVVRAGVPVLSSAPVREGETLTVTAYPDADYALSVLKVNGQTFTSGNDYTVGAEPRVEVLARFRTTRPGFKSVVILPSVGGRVTVSDLTEAQYLDGDEVAVGTELKVIAAASAGYRLAQLSVNDKTDAAGLVKYTVQEDDAEVLIAATFAQETYTLAVEKRGDGQAAGDVEVKVNGNTVTTPLSEVQLHHGDAVELLPKSTDPNVNCISVNVNGRELQAPYVHVVNAENVRAVVVFSDITLVPHPVYLYTDVAGHGTLTINGAQTQGLTHGDAVEINTEKALTVTATPEEGWRLAVLKVNGVALVSGEAWTIPADAEEIRIAAEFVRADMYRLTVAKVGNGVVEVTRKDNPTVTYANGDLLQAGTPLTVTARTISTDEVKALLIQNVQMPGKGKVVSAEYTMPSADLLVQAVFGSADAYMLVVACGPEGKVTVTDSATSNEVQNLATITEGQKLKVKVEVTTPGYGVQRLAVNGDAVDSELEYELEVKSDVVVTAAFARAYTLTVVTTPDDFANRVSVHDVHRDKTVISGGQVLLGETLQVKAEDVNGYNKALRVEGADDLGNNEWLVKDNVTVNVVYTKALYDVTFTVMDEDGNHLEGATVTVSNYSVSEAGGGVYKVQLPNGTYKVTASKDGYQNAELSITVDNKSQNVTITLKVIKTAVESELLSSATITPNPASTFVRLSGVAETTGFAVFSQRGVEVIRGTLRGEETVRLDVSSLVDGVYLVRLEAADGLRVLRFVVAR